MRRCRTLVSQRLRAFFAARLLSLLQNLICPLAIRVSRLVNGGAIISATVNGIVENATARA